MEAASVDVIPEGSDWVYEHKWDGFRCLIFKDHHDIELQSKAGNSLTRYFPEIIQTVLKIPAKRFVLDGELMVYVDNEPSFDDLLLRLHPAESRIKRLAAEHPAGFVLFDLLVDEHGVCLIDESLSHRRFRLERFSRKYLKNCGHFKLSPITANLKTAIKWLRDAGTTWDGIVAKHSHMNYRSGDRTGMLKVKFYRTIDCVVAGFRYATNKKAVGSLLLGLYDNQGLLHHVGFTSSFKASERKYLFQKLKPFLNGQGFTGRSPGGPSRWNQQEREWFPLEPILVVEVSYDHFTGGRFRHGTKLLRWRPDKKPSECLMHQIKGKLLHE
jgi:ATP-dependent DNA ligase